MKGSKIPDLAWEFGHSIDHTRRVLNKMTRLFVHRFFSTYVYMPNKDSRLYKNLVSLFPAYKNVVLAADVTKITIRRPLHYESDYYCGHKHKHCVSVLAFVDGRGLFRHVIGPQPGATNDVTLIRKSGFIDTIDKFLRKGDKVLYDGAFAGPKFSKWFISLKSIHVKNKDITDEMKRDDLTQRQSRIIVERSFGKMKSLFNVVQPVSTTQRYCWAVIMAAIALTNLHSVKESKLKSI